MKNRNGFTLVELLVVMSIIVILTLVAVGGIMSVVKQSRQSGAQTLARVAIQQARTLAIQKGIKVSVVFYPDPTDMSSVSFVFLTPKLENTYGSAGIPVGSNVIWTQLSGTGHTVMAKFADIAGLTSTGITTNYDSMAYNVRAVSFNEQGQFIITSYMAYDPNETGASWWGLVPPNLDCDQYLIDNGYMPGVSSPVLFVYDRAALNDAGFTHDATGDANRQSWIQAHCDPLVLNNVTGGFIK